MPKVLALALACLVASGCSSIVAKMITSRGPSSASSVVSKEQLLQQGFATKNFCSSRQGFCISYLTAAPLASEQRLSYAVEIENGGPSEQISLSMSRATYPSAYRGTVLLLHGFRSSKEFMTNSALYFRFLGFGVLVPDLPGYGDSAGSVSFGPQDSLILAELLDAQPVGDQPIYVLGNSMGAVAATHLARNRSDVQGLILQAPMPIFDIAVANYFSSYSPTLAAVLTQSSIRSGALQALRSANVTLEQTDVKALIPALRVSVLILASATDPVSPLDYFASLASETVTVLPVAARTHPGMAVIGDVEGVAIDRWLTQFR